MADTYYVTTPIYYPSDRLHIGNAYTTVAADALARYHRLKGEDVLFLTGMDEHGQKIEQRARACGQTPKAFVDGMYDDITSLWRTLNIAYDRFIRTTDPDHEAAVAAIYQKLYDQGDIYRSTYEGWYCVSCEAYWTKAQLKDGRCPDCGREVKRMQESCYFFRLSAYQQRLEALLRSKTFVFPESRAHEMLKTFVEPGLEDVAVSRTTFDWGVRLPFDHDHVAYVWIDALANYISALGYPQESDERMRFWPADLQLIGKDIVRFHTLIWPALLMALNLPLPKRIYAHGWLLFDGGKMSKSKGNVVDPTVLVEQYGVDAVRHYLLSELGYGQDGNFTNEALIKRINSDLANDLGNLVSRTTAMIVQWCPDGFGDARDEAEVDCELDQVMIATASAMATDLDQGDVSSALATLFRLIRRANKYIDETAPWRLAKEPGQMARLATVLEHLADVLRVVSVLIAPFMPDTARRVREAIGLPERDPKDGFDLTSWASASVKGRFVTTGVSKGDALFPRLDEAQSLAALEARAAATQTTKRPHEAKAAAVSQIDKDSINKDMMMESQDNTITFDHFASVTMQVGRVVSAEAVPKAAKLLRLTVDFGDVTRQVVSGIARAYTPEELVGKRYVFVTNLAPRTLFGLTSEAMILTAAGGPRGLSLLTPDEGVDPGASIA